MHTKFKNIILPAVGLAALAVPANISGQSADALIDKLVDKGILTVREANELREEADKGFTSAYQAKTGMQDWVTSLRINGDIRGRYEQFSNDHPAFVDRNRFRYRLRAGAVATIRDNFEAGFRLTSSEAQGSFGGDPISGNTTFQDNASKKFVYIDLAYGKWMAINSSLWSATFTVGKMENPFVYSDMVFDGDYTPEGFAQQFAFNLSDMHKIGLNLGQFALDEIGGQSEDPFMLGAQLRLDSTWTKEISTSFGIGGLLITAEENLNETGATTVRVATLNTDGTPGPVSTITTSAASSAVPNVNAGNSRTPAGVLEADFNPFIADAAFTSPLESFWRYNAPFPIRLAAEYMNNPAADDNNEAYAIGITFGKSGKKGLWDISYRWKHLEADSWWEEVVDSDFGALFPGAAYRAGTNIEGHIFKASFSPYDSLTLGVTYFLTQRITGVASDLDEDMGRLQVDAVWKF